MAGLCKLFAILSLSAAAWAFAPGAPANRLLAASGRAEGRPSCAAHRRARPGSGSLRLAMQQRMSDEEYLEIMKAGKAAPEVSPMAAAHSLGPQAGTARFIDRRPRVKLTLLVCLWWQGLGGVERVEGRGEAARAGGLCLCAQAFICVSVFVCVPAGWPILVHCTPAPQLVTLCRLHDTLITRGRGTHTCTLRANTELRQVSPAGQGPAVGRPCAKVQGGEPGGLQGGTVGLARHGRGHPRLPGRLRRHVRRPVMVCTGTEFACTKLGLGALQGSWL